MGSPGHPSDPTRPGQAHGQPGAWNPSNPNATPGWGQPQPQPGPTGWGTQAQPSPYPQGPTSNHPPPNLAAPTPNSPGFVQGPASGHTPYDPSQGYSQAPAQGSSHGYPQAHAQGYSRGPEGGSSYTPPPPPPPSQHNPPPPQGGGFGDPGHHRKMWRNLALVGVGLIAAGWLILWILGLLAARLVDWVPTDVDVAIGEQNWKELAPESAQCTDPAPLAYVEELAQPLIAAADSEFEFQFVVVDDEQINAFALPGGFVTVNMGLLEAAESGEEVAAVIAHEMAHVTHRHGMRAVMRRVGGIALISMVFGGTNLETIAWAAEGLSGQAHSRDQEREADEVGRELLMKAGVDPTGMATFFERLEAEGGGLPGAAVLLSTHPNPGERADTTREIAAGFTPTVDLPDPPEDLNCR